jgi:hypothetical protein
VTLLGLGLDWTPTSTGCWWRVVPNRPLALEVVDSQLPVRRCARDSGRPSLRRRGQASSAQHDSEAAAPRGRLPLRDASAGTHERGLLTRAGLGGTPTESESEARFTAPTGNPESPAAARGKLTLEAPRPGGPGPGAAGAPAVAPRVKFPMRKKNGGAEANCRCLTGPGRWLWASSTPLRPFLPI